MHRCCCLGLSEGSRQSAKMFPDGPKCRSTGEATSQATRKQLFLRARTSLAFFCSFGATRPWTGSACSITHNTVHATHNRLKTARTQPCQLCPTGIAAERPLAAGDTLLQKKTAKLETAATHAEVYQASRISADCASST